MHALTIKRSEWWRGKSSVGILDRWTDANGQWFRVREFGLRDTLWRDDNLKHPLGFLALVCGASEIQVRHAFGIVYVGDSLQWPERCFEDDWIKNRLLVDLSELNDEQRKHWPKVYGMDSLALVPHETQVIQNICAINKDPSITEVEREEQLTTLFASINVWVTFID